MRIYISKIRIKFLVPCFRCGKLGHVAYEKTCPKYNEEMTNEEKRKRGTNYFLIEVEPSRLDRLVTEFNRDYDSYHNTGTFYSLTSNEL